MSVEYDKYIAEHKENVKKGYRWIERHIPVWIENHLKSDIFKAIETHDDSKTNRDEYEAYDAYFYGGNKSYNVVANFDKAWLLHIHRNEHHWQHWVLINDESEKELVALEMPYEYIIEMICDWWSFSWKTGNLYEILDWYDERKSYIKLHDITRRYVERILADIKKKLDDLGPDNWFEY